MSLLLIAFMGLKVGFTDTFLQKLSMQVLHTKIDAIVGMTRTEIV